MAHQPLSLSRAGLVSLLAASLLPVASGIAAAQGNSPSQLRRFIDQQVGGIQKLMVPAHDTDFRSHGSRMESLTRASRRPKRSGTWENSCFTTRFARPEF